MYKVAEQLKQNKKGVKRMKTGKWAKELRKSISVEDKGVRFISEMVNFATWLALRSFWCGDGADLDDLVVDLDLDLRDYYYEKYCRTNDYQSKDTIMDAIMKLVIEAVKDKEGIAVYYSNGKPAIVGLREEIEEMFNEEIENGDYSLIPY